jgi:superfamily II DNA or RNA helicase
MPVVSGIELSEKILADAGGWQAMKEARGLLKAGRVLSANWEPPRLTGEVQGGSGSITTGLLIEGPIDVESLCTCMENRRWGRICAHALAVGLRVLHPPEVTPAAKPGNVARREPDFRIADVISFSEGDDDEALRAELHVIISPNFESALMTGRATVAFEFSVGGSRRPLNLLSSGDEYRWSGGDRAALEFAVKRAGGQLPVMLQLDLAGFGELIGHLEGSGNVTLGRKTVLAISEEAFPLQLVATLLGNGEILLRAKLPNPAPMILPGSVFRVLSKGCFRRLVLPAGGAALLQGEQKISRERVPVFLERQFGEMMATGCLEADFTPDDFAFETARPRLRLELEGGLARLRARLHAVYESATIDLSEPVAGDAWFALDGKPRAYLRRDLDRERDALVLLVRQGFTGPDKEGRWELRGENEVLRFFAREYVRLQKEWDVNLQERLDWALEKKTERIEPRCEFTPSGEQWFDFAVRYETSGGERFSAADIRRLVLGGQNSTRLRNGKIALLDVGAVEELEEVLIDASPRQSGDAYRMRREQAAFVADTVGERNGWAVRAPAAFAEQGRDERLIDISAFDEILRPYQKEGVEWMLKLRAKGFGGILADEMGLVKTVQTLAVIASVRRADAGNAAPFLVICPTSLVGNWKAEAAKFAPELKVLAVHGADRRRHSGGIPEYDLIITSYALIRRDWDLYDPVEFDTVILDEAQHIKNRKTQNAQAVKALRSRHRLVLTGTPMENSVLDLWSIFDFLMPSYLGGAQDFRDRYELPMSKTPDPSIRERLGRRVRPFILRRMKRDVAKDLPEKIELVSYCDLTEQQRAVYRQILDAGRKEVLESVDKNGFGKSKMVIFNALLRLRQICCDLRLLKLDDVDESAASGKTDLFGELLEEAIDGGHRLLVFSQFTSMLGLLKERLEAESLEYCYLDGSTRGRSEVVDRFQNSDIPVFLISLKAGGVGLNLTGADTVVHFDPWWNPAIEDQATGRAHRIGQRNVVTSYKLIARDTVEEKILRLQEKKREAIQSVFGDEEQLADALSWDEVQDLFA